MNDIISYLIRFLSGDETTEEAVYTIGYTANPALFGQYDLVIIPSGFFREEVYGQQASLPLLPLAEWEGVPVLYGSPEVEKTGDTFVVHADLIASAYFLLSRYEEMMRRKVRDAHGRFPGKESLPYRAGFLHRPVVDEYRRLLRGCLQKKYPALPAAGGRIASIELTHDIDAPFLYRSWKGLIRSIRDGRGLACSLKGKFGKPENDPYYTFPRLIEQDRQLQEKRQAVVTTVFVKAGGWSPFDKPRYPLGGKDIQRLLRLLTENGMRIGLHASYEAGEKPQLLAREKARLSRHAQTAITGSRHHFLSCREPEDMRYLEAAGITDDFTMGYADVAGFRLGTCRPVRYIDPVARRLTSLTLHPLTIMDGTLELEKYMGLTCDEAATYCLRLVEQVEKAGGVLSLLWHNSSMVEGKGSYLPELYAFLLNELARRADSNHV
jgi:hypothetical protein